MFNKAVLNNQSIKSYNQNIKFISKIKVLSFLNNLEQFMKNYKLRYILYKLYNYILLINFINCIHNKIIHII